MGDFAALSGNHLLNDRTFDVLGEPIAGDAAIVIDARVCRISLRRMRSQKRLAIQLDVIDPFSARPLLPVGPGLRTAAPGRPCRRAPFPTVVKPRKPPPGSLTPRERGVGNVRRQSADDQWNADPDAD